MRPAQRGQTAVRKRLRIACIGARGLPATYSGIERACERLYGGLAERGHAITMYCRSEYVTAPGQRFDGIALRSAPAIRTRALDTLSHVASSLAHALTVGRYDVVHLHALAPNVFSRACRIRRVPVVATVHGLDWQRAKWRGLGSRVLRFAEGSMVANADSVIVVSRALQDYFRATYSRDTHYIPNGIDATTDPIPAGPDVLRQHGLTPGGYVLFLGRLVPEKRVHDLVAAFRRLDSPLRLAIVGEGSHTDAYVRSLFALAAGDPRIVFTGLQRQPAVRAFFRHAALYVLPSEMEGLPTSVLECLAEGTPLVLSDIPPHREVLAADPRYDLFFPPADVDALTARVRQALARADYYREVAADARDRARRDYAWPSIVDRTEDVFQTVAAA
jgi:glycosyltransferase involved in cell wall biosynthesis